jgi:hypothetical protein
MPTLRDICRDINGITVGDPDDAIACIMLDPAADLKAVVLPNALIIHSPKVFSEIALDEVREVRHDPKTHRLTIVAKSGKIELAPESFV